MKKFFRNKKYSVKLGCHFLIIKYLKISLKKYEISPEIGKVFCFLQNILFITGDFFNILLRKKCPNSNNV